MRFVSISLLLLALGCSTPEELPHQPPAQRDRQADLLQFEQPLETLKRNPPPQGWMLGCFAISAAGLSNPPSAIELTSDEKQVGAGDVRTFYRVRSLDPRHSEEMWSWLPPSASELKVVLSDGFSGWEFDLRRGADRLVGSGHLFTDVPPFDRDPVAASLIRKPCG